MARAVALAALFLAACAPWAQCQKQNLTVEINTAEELVTQLQLWASGEASAELDIRANISTQAIDWRSIEKLPVKPYGPGLVVRSQRGAGPTVLDLANQKLALSGVVSRPIKLQNLLVINAWVLMTGRDSTA